MAMSRRTDDDALIGVGELARETGPTVRTLHHDEAVGLLEPSARTDSGHRLYGPTEIERLYRVATLRRLRLSLAQIRTALDDPDWLLTDSLGYTSASKVSLITVNGARSGYQNRRDAVQLVATRRLSMGPRWDELRGA
ncbi:putative MerR family transcriptional regulator [Gordonia polyisoprenivorans NBRC 16320 = JCM 10675]|nr:putative MerR family transcriptional regulator [Gordonia polyisoprenivorans NBRC 16320 = JCM 10675]